MANKPKYFTAIYWSGNGAMQFIVSANTARGAQRKLRTTTGYKFSFEISEIKELDAAVARQTLKIQHERRSKYLAKGVVPIVY